MNKSPKVLVIGVDAATLDLIQLWKEDLPNFRMLMEQGVWGKLESSIPPVTCPAWNCMFTGKNPGKIGIFTHWVLPIYSEKIPQLINYSFQDSASIWELLSDAGIKVGVMSVPTSFPPRTVNGFMISDWFEMSFQKNTNFTYPSEFKRKLKTLNYGVRSLIDLSIKGRETAYIKRYKQITERQFDAIKVLITTEPWDFFTCVLNATDGVQHYLWHHVDPAHPWHVESRARRFKNGILEIYQEMDEGIGKLLSVISKEVTVLIVSDHGAQANHGQFLVNEWLMNEGFLVLKQMKDNPGKLFYDMLAGLTGTMMKFLPPSAVDAVKKVIPSTWFYKLYDRIVLQGEKTLINRIDWEKTKAYSVGMAGGIFINLRNRDKYGIVDFEEYESLRSRLSKMLLDLRGPNGEPLENRIFKKEEIYSGQYLNVAPDLIFSIDNYRYVQMPNVGKGTIWAESMNSGWHDLFGTFIAFGPDIKQGVKIEGTKIYDITPTILHIFGLPVDPEMDGRVLTEIFTESSEPAQRIVKYRNVPVSKAVLKEKIRLLKNSHRLNHI